jgi:acyl-CoA reductase-like NAD-dependent aldehyde dehydrogenase
MNLPLKIANSVLVGGEWVRATGEPEPVVDPATEEVIGLAPTSGPAELEGAVAAAREAFDTGPWPRMAPEERAAKLYDLHAALMERKPEIQRLLVEEAGVVSHVLTAQFDFPMGLVLESLDAGGRSRDQPLGVGAMPNRDGAPSLVGAVVRREPVGVVTAITAYNFPFFLNVQKLFPALVTGNTVVLKPSPYTPFVALALAEAAHEVGFPRGVLSVVPGGREAGRSLTVDPRVDLISFTGSDATGSAIMAQGSASLKRLHMELGGKSAMIVRADADLDRAVVAGLSSLAHSGQGCASTSRHLVHNSLRRRYVERLAEGCQALRLGHPADPATTLGPLIRETIRARTEGYVEDALKAGARLAAGGRRPPGFRKGFFYEPTVFDNVDPASRLAQDEVFGPVLAVIGFDTDEEAVAIANNSRYGLSGAIWSRDLGAAYEMACAIRTGGVAINGGGAPAGAPITPFGGIKRSGFGREWGVEGLNAFTDQKAISFSQL